MIGKCSTTTICASYTLILLLLIKIHFDVCSKNCLRVQFSFSCKAYKYDWYVLILSRESRTRARAYVEILYIYIQIKINERIFDSKRNILFITIIIIHLIFSSSIIKNFLKRRDVIYTRIYSFICSNPK